MSETKLIGETVARSAETAISLLIHNDEIPSITTRPEAMDAIEKIVTQSPRWESRRVWATAFAALTAVLAVPEVQVMLGSWAPVVTAIVSALLAGWDKLSDPRPTR